MRQAVILAGGQATRMRPYTDDRPKAMVEVAGAPILEHQLRWLAGGEVRDVVLSVGYRAEVIRDHIGDGAGFGLNVQYAVEDEPLGRGGGLRFAALRLPHPDEGWFGMNGDVLSRFDIADLSAQHERLGATATIALAPYKTTWGIADLDGDLVRGFVQSPRLPYWINAGIYCMSPEMVGLLPTKGDHEDSTFPSLALAGKLGAFKIEGYWRGIDTVKDIQEASADLLSGSV
jgi:NDP-sugar pyrophosphorylase family protein